MLNEFVRGYIECALSVNKYNGAPLEQNFKLRDISDEALKLIESDCSRFYNTNRDLFEDDYAAGYDFYLSRNGMNGFKPTYPQYKQLRERAQIGKFRLKIAIIPE